MPMQQQQKLPFRQGTVKRRQPVTSVAVTPGSRISTIRFPQVGMLGRVACYLHGTITQSGAGTVNPFGYSALFGQTILKTNQGSSAIAQLTGFGIEVVNRKLAPNALPVRNTYGNAAAANAVEYGFFIPVAANQRIAFDMGLINLQAPDIEVTLDITFNPIASFVNNVTATNLTLDVWYEYWDIPADPRYELPALVLCQTIEESPIPILRTGDNTWQIPRMGTMFDLGLLVSIGADYANLDTDVDRWRLVYNTRDTQYDMAQALQKLVEADLYNRAASPYMTPGVIDVNLWEAGNAPWNGGDFRDAVDTEENTTTQVIVTVNSGVTLTDAQSDFIVPVRRIVQALS